MIPYQLALMAWIPAAALLMLDRNGARGFAFAIFGGMLILPAGAIIQIEHVPGFDKIMVSATGAFIGTCLFHSQLIFQTRLRWMDLTLTAALASIFFTALQNNTGAYDGLSDGAHQFLQVFLLCILGRIHLSTPGALRSFLTIMVLAASIYVPLALWEWRFSPQLHRMAYGYFQHDFVQFERYFFGQLMYRPVVCFPHALVLGRFFAFAAFLALCPLRRDFAAWHPAANFLGIIPLAGLIISMSYGPYLLFAGLCGCYLIWARWGWTRYVVFVPVAGFIFLMFVFAGSQPLNGAVDLLSRINLGRAMSLKYRLDALSEYSINILKRPLWGHGGWGRGRIDGRATDALFLIYALKWGFIGAGLQFLWWLWASYIGLRVARATRHVRFGALAAGASFVVPLSVAMCVFEAGLDPHVMAIAGGVTGIDVLIRELAGVHREKAAQAVRTHASASAE